MRRKSTDSAHKKIGEAVNFSVFIFVQKNAKNRPREWDCDALQTSAEEQADSARLFIGGFERRGFARGRRRDALNQADDLAGEEHRQQ